MRIRPSRLRPPGIWRGAHRRALRAGQRRGDGRDAGRRRGRQGEAGFYDIPPLTRVRDYSRDGVRRSPEESLERLGLDRVDIVLIHDPDDFMEQRRTSRTRRWPNSALRARSAPSALASTRPPALPGSSSAATRIACWWPGATPCSISRPPTRCSRSAYGAAWPCWRAACSTAASWPTPVTARAATMPGVWRPAGRGPPAPGCLRRVRRPAGRSLAALHIALPGGDGRRRGCPHARGNCRRRLPTSRCRYRAGCGPS
jgi:Aldo/keto reductase family